MPIDYDKLAQQFGGSSQPQIPTDNYDSLAKKFGGAPKENVSPSTATEEKPSLSQFLLHALTGNALGMKKHLPAAVDALKSAGNMVADVGPSVAGAAIGGTLGASLGPAGIIGGGALGAAAGGQFKDLMNQAVQGEQVPTVPEAAMRRLNEAGQGILQEGVPVAAVETGKRVAPALEQSAEKQMGQVLAPTTKANKYLTKNKIVPGLLERGEVVGSRAGLEQKAGEQVSKYGKQLDDYLSSLPPTATSNIKPVLDRIDRLQQKYVVKGTNVIANQQGYDNLETMKQTLLKVAGNSQDVSVESLRSLRQIWDTAVSEAGGFAGKDMADKSILKAQEYSSNAIRKELAKDYPDMAKINAEFSFWKNTQKVIKETNERKIGQERPLSEKIFQGGAIGGVLGGGIAAGTGHTQLGVEAATAALATKYLSQLVRSPAWKSVNANLKYNLSKSLASGDSADVLKLLSRTGITLGVGAQQEQTESQ